MPRALQRRLDGPTTVPADVVQRMLSTHAAVHNTFTFDAIWKSPGSPLFQFGTHSLSPPCNGLASDTPDPRAEAADQWRNAG